MCTRFALTANAALLQKLLGLEKTFEWSPRYNVAPSQSIPAVLRPLESENRELKMLRFGFAQVWDQGGRLIVNARSEDIQNKPLFRESFEKWRCAIPMDGFYEWRHEGKETRPYFIRMASKEPFLVAGVWAPQQAGGQMVNSAAILTTAANYDLAFIHDRMPVILRPQDLEAWLDKDDVLTLDRIEKLMKPFRTGALESFEVDDWVNSSSNEGEKCIAPYDGPSTLSLF